MARLRRLWDPVRQAAAIIPTLERVCLNAQPLLYLTMFFAGRVCLYCQEGSMVMGAIRMWIMPYAQALAAGSLLPNDDEGLRVVVM